MELFVHFRFDAEKQGRRVEFDYRGVEKEPCFSAGKTFQRGIWEVGKKE